jgi:hypothetical protein
MKPTNLLIGLYLSTLLLAGCGKQEQSATTDVQNAEAFATHYKQGKGLLMPEETKKTLGVQIAEVAETKLAPIFTAEVQVFRRANDLRKVSSDAKAPTAEASGQISSEQAKALTVGQAVTLEPATPGADKVQGKIIAVDQLGGSKGAVEVLIEIPDAEGRFPIGTGFEAVFAASEPREVTAIPLSALLESVEGTFAYTINDKYLLRTAVKTGARNDEFVEITDGLYAGDQIVTTPVLSLWLAELQAIKGGKPCCAVAKK